ncbi:hypothetical protein, partial [Aeromonas sp. QDB66]|uniref:hypothetical protein n=1 Tax=Aeromonas sp. QDB66 TaxID=2989824 RepID=UPI0022E67E15
KQAGKWDQETIVSFFLCQYCSGEYLPPTLVHAQGAPAMPLVVCHVDQAPQMLVPAYLCQWHGGSQHP